MSETPDYSGKTVFVAGASGGINLGVATAFGRAGARVAVISRNRDRISEATRALVAEGIQAIGMAADVRDYAAVETAFNEAHLTFGEIDVVISGAAGNFVAPALGMSANAFKAVVDIDLLGTFNVLRASYAFLRRPGASLLSISAPQGKRPVLFQAHVCAAKAGVNMLTQCLAMEWGPDGIRVNAISPGPIMGTEGMARLTPTPEAEAATMRTLSLRSYGTKDDIANLAMFLGSERAKFITGAVIECDGGATLGDASQDRLTQVR